MSAAETRAKRGIPVWFLALGLICAATGFCWSQGDRVAAGALLLLAVSGIIGYRMGLARVGGLVCAVAAAYALAPGLGARLQPFVETPLHQEDSDYRLVSLTLAALTVIVGLSLLIRFLSWLLLRHRPRLIACNGWLGCAVGIAQGTLLVLFLLGGAIALKPMAENRLSQPSESEDALAQATARQIQQLAEQARTSRLGPWVERFNPFERIAVLRGLSHSARVATRPIEVEEADPVLRAWRESPVIKDAVDRLNADPEIREMLAAGRPFDRRSALTLLRNPTVNKLLAEPQLVSQLWDLLSEIETRE